MKNALLIILGAILAVISFSCTSHEVKEKLAVSEEIMMSQPDSALTLIESIDPKQLHTDKDEALYGLLYTMATLKNNLPLQNDTLINYSVEYFDKKSDKKHLAMSLCYQGIVQQLSGYTYSALLSYLHALDVSEEIEDKFYNGLACRGIADIYSESYNSGDELAYAKREYDNFKAAGIQPFVNYAMLDLARAYHNNEEFAEVYRLTEQINDSAITAKDSNLLEESIRTCAMSYLGDGKHKNALELYEYLCHNNMSNKEDSSYMTIAYALTDNPSKALHFLYNTKFESPLSKELASFHVSDMQGKANESLIHYKKIDSLTNNQLKEKFGNNFSTTVSSNYQTQIKQNREIIKKSRIILWSFITITILIISIICYLSITHINKQKKDIENKILLAEQLQEALNQTKTENKASSELIQEIISSKYEMLDRLCNIIASTPDNKIARKKIADEVTNLIDKISINGSNMQRLENEVDRLFNNIYSSLKIDFPDLKELDYHLFILSALGFKPTAITFFLKQEKINFVYERKRRLKNKITKSDKPLREKYIQLLH
jgi:hypothetical protein